VANDVDVKDLAGIGLFSGVKKKDLHYVAAQFKRQWFKRGEPIVRLGDPGGRLFVITEGEARVVGADGRTRKRLGKGGLIGELSVFDPAPRSVTIEAISDVSTLTLSSTAFLALLEDQPSISRAVIMVVVRRLREAEGRAAALQH
jgi:CRP-like cAMP-binding protein